MGYNRYEGSKPTDFGFAKETVTKTASKTYPTISLNKKGYVFSDDEKIIIEFVSKKDSPRLYSGVADKFFNRNNIISKNVKNRLYGNDYRYRKNLSWNKRIYNLNFDSERLGNFTVLIKDFDEYSGYGTINKNIMIDEKSINRIICDIDFNEFSSWNDVKKYYYSAAKRARYDDTLFDYEAHMFIYLRSEKYCKKSYIGKVRLVDDLQIKNINNEILYNKIKDYFRDHEQELTDSDSFSDWLEEQRLKDFQVNLFDADYDDPENPEPEPEPTRRAFITSNCIGCRDCISMCQFDAILDIDSPESLKCQICGVDNQHPEINTQGVWKCSVCSSQNKIAPLKIDEEKCILCGACQEVCPVMAIVLS